MLKMIVGAALAVGAASPMAPAARAQDRGRECRDVTQSENGRPRVVKMCRDTDGQWRPLAGKSGVLAPNFRGKIVYQGNYETDVERKARVRSPVRAPTRLTLGSLLNAARGSPKKSTDAPAGESQQGTSVYTIEYDGNLVTGTWQMNDGRRRMNGRFSGTRQGSECQLFDERQSSFVATCDAGVFRGEGNSAESSRTAWTTRFDAASTELVDYVERDRLAAAARAEAAAKAKAAREAELAQRAQLRARLPKGAVARYKPLLDRAVIADSAHWFANRYSAGSIDLVGVQNDTQSGSVFLKAYFQYSSGREGWVGAIVKAGRVQCLQFWDDPSGCRGIGDGANAKMAQGFLNSMMSGGGGGDGGHSAGARAEEDLEYSRNIARQVQESRPTYMGPTGSASPASPSLPVPCVGGPC